MKTTDGEEIEDLRIAPVEIITGGQGFGAFDSEELWRLTIRLEGGDVLETVVTEVRLGDPIEIETVIDELEDDRVAVETADRIEHLDLETNQETER